ncbi:MAG TPA: response regulator [Rhodothermales bacterium]|nr:response regulator [Rhodothermales bacterium]
MKTLVFAASHIQRRAIVNALLALGHTDIIEVQDEDDARGHIAAPPEGVAEVDLVIVSWETTDFSKLHLVPWIRQESRRPRLPAIVVSDRSSPDDVILALRWGADSYIARPFDTGLLERKIDSVLHIPEPDSTQLPASPPDDSALTDPDIFSRGAVGKPRVLVVDDHQPALTLISLCLRQDYEVVAVSTLRDGIAEAASGSFDVAIIDINLNGESGTDLLDVMLMLPEYRTVPKIACTAFAMQGDRERLLALGFDGYVSKPFRKTQLLEALQHVRRPTTSVTPVPAVTYVGHAKSNER